MSAPGRSQALVPQPVKSDGPPAPAQDVLALLQAEAVRAGLLDAAEAPPQDGVPTEAAAAAIEQLVERELVLPDPDETALRRHHAANPARFGGTGERVRLRHVLFAVTPGVDVKALRERAEACLIDLRASGPGGSRASGPGGSRASGPGEPTAGADRDRRFAKAARELSNCPSAAEGGELGWLAAADCAPEFAREIFFGHTEVGVLPRLVHSRFGLHVVEVLERQAGQAPPFEAVREAVARSLGAQAYVTALQQYLRVLAEGKVLVQ
jgi:peptidyl-prolyl cis-trans isomerase C